MGSKKPAYRLLSRPERHEAIAALAEQQGFKSVAAYLHALIDADAKQHHFEMPPKRSTWGGKRRPEGDDIVAEAGRTVIVKNARRLQQGQKMALLNPVTKQDSGQVNGQWQSANFIKERDPLEAVQHFGRHQTTVGEVIEVEDLASAEIVGDFEVQAIYKIWTSNLTRDEVQAIGYTTIEALEAHEHLGERAMWLVWIQPINRSILQ